MKAETRMMHVDHVAGRVLVGPKKLRSCFARIISLKDGSGRIEKFDLTSRTWLEAPESVTFSEVWCAPPVPMLQLAEMGGKS
jgi:hypothetical protein